MLILPNNCRCSDFNVYPKNWKTTKAKLSSTWYADGCFYDPAYLSTYPKGKPIRLKGGVNRFQTLAERRIALTNLITEMEDRLKLGYNPITQRSSPVVPDGSTVQPDTPFIIALRMSLLKYKGVKETLDDMNSTLNRLERSAIALKFDKIHRHDIQTKHIKLCLDHAMETNERFTEKRFNKKLWFFYVYEFILALTLQKNIATIIRVRGLQVPTYQSSSTALYTLLKESSAQLPTMLNNPFIKQSNLHVLIADDDLDDIHFFQEALHDIIQDFKLSVVSNGVELMEFLHIIVPDLIFLDINMPCKTGIECLSEIRELHNLTKLPVVVYSTASTPRQVEKTYELGANLYFEKPSSSKSMKDGLTKILSYTSQELLNELPRDVYVIRA